MAKNVSNNFKNIIKNGGPFYSYAVMTLADGTVIELSSENDFTVSGSGYSEDAESGFPLGSALSKAITLNLDNTVAAEPLQDTVSNNILDTQNEEILTERKSKNYDYYYARIALYTEADLPDGTTERIQEGIFTVIDSVTPGDVLEINAYDDMYKANVEFTSSLTYPVSAQMLLNEVCSKCDITLGSATFKNNNFQIQQAPEGLTGRQVIGYIAQIAGGNAVIDSTGHLVIKSYDFSEFDVEEDVTAGEVETDSGIHIISEYTSDPDIGTDDITITGVSVTIESEDYDEEDETYIVGSEEYAISINNPLITGQEKTAVDLIAESVIGITIRPFSGDFMPDPTVEFMDLAYVVDRNDIVYKTFITTHDFNYLGSSTFACGVESPERHSGSYYSTAAEVYQKAKKDLKVNRTQWEQAIENLSQQVANASGLYTTEEVQPDGSTIFYMHNKPTLEESDIVWKMTAETLTVSTDGGKTWNAGITVNGEVIARIMNTIGINFDWGVGGTLIVQDEDGNQTAYINAETGTVRFAVESLTITGKTVQEIASEQSETAINDFVDAIYTPKIDNIQKQIDGQIETYYYDYEPTLSNVPAIDWTSEEERKSHEGDLFYWKSRGYAYRFFKDGDTWKWQMVQDTDITKALEQAAEAQDTADQKRRVFVVTPNPPYDVGDLWVGNNTSDLMRCQRARSSGSYNADDWIKAVKYTDDTELNNFIREDYSETIQEILNSVDKKAQTWYQTTDPSLDWASIEESVLQDTDGNSILDSENNDIITLWEKEKSTHDGDLWRNPANNTEYMYVDGNWVEMSIPDEVFDTIDGKAQIFVTQPVPPYDVGDTWFTGTTILVCDTRRDSGEFVAEDWSKQDNYTDDSALYEFMEGDYKQTIEELQTQADSKAETWYQPTDPSDLWSNEEKLRHDGDIWYNTSSQKTYIYNGSSWEETKSNPPDEVFDTIDGKAQIFVRQPVPPYSVGDLWFNSATSDIMTCITARPSGSYNAKDWEKRNKYTDDSYAQEINDELNRFIEDYNVEIQEIANSIDKKSETWYQTSDPADQWTDNVDNDPLLDTNGNNITDTTGENITTVWEKEKMLHDGDLWHNPNTNKEYIYVDGEWKETSIPDDVFDIIDGKAQIFVSTPTPPYAIGDLWFNSATSDIMTCINGRESGSYASSDWQKRNKYTDDSYAEEVAGNLSNFADQVVGDLENMQTQIDGKIETYYYDYQPTLTNIPASAWTTETERQKHIGDLFYYKSTGFTYRFLKDGSTWKWQPIKDEDISKALSDAADAQDTADSKRRVFTSTPTPPYDVGDLWAQGSSGDIMRCIRSRSSGNYTSSDWDKASKYTDDSAVEDLDTSLDKQGVFDRLTNYGEVKGIFLESDGQLYINASYLMTGILKVSQPGASGKETFYANMDTGEVRIVANSFSLKGKSISEIADEEVNDFIDNVYSPTISNLQSQIDGQIETWFYNYVPTTSNAPASNWTTDSEKERHLGDLFYVVDNEEYGGQAYRWAKINNAYTWDYVEDTAVTKALADAAEAQDTADQKRRVFVTTPTPPYDVGDLWVGNDTSDLMRCQRSRSTGNYDASDWIKAVKYTDDSELYNFVQNDYNTTIREIYDSVDRKAETWYQDSDPALDWTENEESPLQDLSGDNILDISGGTITTIWEKEKSLHDGDLWKNPSNNVEYIYKDGSWIEMAIPDAVFDTIDGKAQIFVTQPVPPYNVGDTWFTGTTILVCNNRRDSGGFVQSDWAKNDNYTDDSALYEFISGDFAEVIGQLQDQTDKKAETWCQNTDPALNWTAEEKAGHTGDLWYNTAGQKTYIYNGTGWEETKSTPPDEVFDSIDGKAQIFVSTPAPPYSVGDLWFDSASSDIMTCIYSRESGNFNAGDWQKRNKYTDDSALQNFLSGEYSETITELKTQADKKAETWYQGTDPSTSWNATQKAEHEGDLWYNTSNQKTYIYDGSAWRETKSTPPDEVFDEIDGKAQIFITQPTPPYSKGDLWFDSTTSDIMTCIASRSTGSFNAGDWQKRNKYTDDSALQNFLSGEYSETITELKTQADKKAETWYQGTDPSTSWNATQKAEHEGDLWYNTSNQKTYIYDGSAWRETKSTPPDEVFDEIDGKAQIFITQPTPPYSKGDLWFDSTTSDIMTCIASRSTGSFNAGDWQKRNKYTDDSYAETVEENLNIFSESVAGSLNNMQEQIDGKIETWYYNYQPTLTNIPASQWTTEEERHRHIGDLFYWQDKGFTYRFQQGGSGYVWQAIQDSDITEALDQAAQAQDTADRKRQVFYSTPYPPYDVGDLWAQGANGDIMRCRTARQTGSYVSTDWEKASKYTDDTSVIELDESLDMYGVFNRLTNGGTVQGLYMENGQLYVLFTYAKGGVLSLGGKNNGYGYLQIRDDNDKIIGEIDRNGIGIIGSLQTSYVNSDGSKIWSILSKDSINFYDKNKNNVAFLYRTQTSENHQIMRMFGKDGISIRLSSGELYSILDDALMYYQNKKRHHNFYNDERHNGDSYFSRILLGSDDDNDVALSFVSYEGRAVSVDGGLYAYGNLGCSGKKYRIVDTENYEKRLLCAYETPSPYFGDIGCGVIDENGICVISFDDIFLETVNTESQYQVFIQKEGEGDIWVEEKGFNYFSVKGTPFLKFSWEVKARQKDYDSERLEILREDAIEKDIDYEGEAMNMVLSYYNSLEGMFV